MSDGDPAYTAMEKKIDQSKTLAQRKFVLLNDGSDGLSLPAGTTRDWFNVSCRRGHPPRLAPPGPPLTPPLEPQHEKGADQHF
jgi:hypothetical protein